jgi:hypothetical protein
MHQVRKQFSGEATTNGATTRRKEIRDER